MAELHMISPPQERRGRAREHQGRAQPAASGVQENYAMDAVQNELSGLLTDEQTDEGGLKIYTTIDPELQKLATQAVEHAA